MIFLPQNVKTPHSQLKQPGFKSSSCCIKALAVVFPHITTVHSVVNEYPATDSGGNVDE